MTDFEQKKARAEELRNVIEYHNRQYYEKDAPEIEDFEYDRLMHELIDIETLYHYMENEGHFRVSRATLYNTIILLMDANLIIKHQFGTSSQYERAYKNETHHHMICTECGKVTEFQDESLKQAIANTKLKKFTATHYSLYIYGVCSKCTWAKRRKKKSK